MLTESERLILAAAHVQSLGELAEEWMDTDGVLGTPGSLHLWQKWLLAGMGHSPMDHVRASEKLWARLAKLLDAEDPAFAQDDLVQAALARATELDALLRPDDTPASLCITLAAFCGLVAERLAPALEGAHPPRDAAAPEPAEPTA